MQKNKKGQVAIMLLLVLIILTTITTAVVAIAFSSSSDTTSYSIGEEAYTLAETGAQNAILSLIRNSSYAGESNLSIGDGSVTIEVATNGESRTITSEATVGNMVRTIQVEADLTGGKLTVESWKEI